MHQSGASSSSTQPELNPANNIPFNLNFGSSSSSSSSSNHPLSAQRTISSIPRGSSSPPPGASPYDRPASGPSACPVALDSNAKAGSSSQPSNWEYPSPSQFQAALARKDKAAPPEHVEMMVAVHNFLNEEAWKQVVDWETREFGTPEGEISLMRFQGRPGDLSPRARWYGLMGSVWPSRYSSAAPFDRHDWIVGRPDGSTARYVIDYYGDDEADARDEAKRQMREERVKQIGEKEARLLDQREDAEDDEGEGDEAHFVLDVRPAVDSFAAIRARAARTFRGEARA